jgi:hypothetical protein
MAASPYAYYRVLREHAPIDIIEEIGIHYISGTFAEHRDTAVDVECQPTGQ